MPVLKHAKKKMKQDKKRALQNKRIRSTFRELLKAAKAKPNTATVGEAFSSLDRAAKQHIIHKNKAARLKSSLSKLLPKTSSVAKARADKEETKVEKTPVAKKASTTKKKTTKAA